MSNYVASQRLRPGKAAQAKMAAGAIRDDDVADGSIETLNRGAASFVEDWRAFRAVFKGD